MTNAEFIAWFEGYTKRLKGRPGRKEWQEIADQVARIEGNSTIKAWFEGYTKKIKGAPSDKEWREIKAQVEAARGEADGKRSKLRALFDSFEVKSNRMDDNLDRKAK